MILLVWETFSLVANLLPGVQDFDLNMQDSTDGLQFANKNSGDVFIVVISINAENFGLLSFSLYLEFDGKSIICFSGYLLKTMSFGLGHPTNLTNIFKYCFSNHT